MTEDVYMIITLISAAITTAAVSAKTVSAFKLADVITSILSNSVSVIIAIGSFIYAHKAHKSAKDAHDRLDKQNEDSSPQNKS